MENIEVLDEGLEMALNPAPIMKLVNRVNQEHINAMLLDNEPDPVRNENYAEIIIPQYNPDEFYSHFRMSRNVFEELATNVGGRIEIMPTVPVMKKLLFTVWMLAKPEAFIACCDRFGFSTGTGHLILHDMCRTICQMMEIEIFWPRNEEAMRTARYFEEKTRFPGIIGAVDGCHIPIKAPRNNPIDYYNRKSFHSIILQGVCNEKMAFIDIFVGMPGRVHDARVFRTSPLYIEMTNNRHFIPEPMHLLGDSAYPLQTNVMVTFRDNGHLTAQQHRYNEVLSSARSKVEQAFGRLKGKWRRLKYLDMDIENIPYVVTAACVLHNYTIRMAVDEENVEDYIVEAVEGVQVGEQDEPQADIPQAAMQKRQAILQLF